MHKPLIGNDNYDFYDNYGSNETQHYAFNGR